MRMQMFLFVSLASFSFDVCLMSSLWHGHTALSIENVQKTTFNNYQLDYIPSVWANLTEFVAGYQSFRKVKE